MPATATTTTTTTTTTTPEEGSTTMSSSPPQSHQQNAHISSSAGGSEGLRQRFGESGRSNSASSLSAITPRLIARDLPFYQSRNNYVVTNDNHHSGMYRLQLRDWFHVFLRWPVFLSLFFLLVIWTAIILCFAAIYRAIDTTNKDTDCGLGDPGIPIAWGTSFAFSLETCTTVGCKYVIYYIMLNLLWCKRVLPNSEYCGSSLFYCRFL
jgi:hypothetical protein